MPVFLSPAEALFLATPEASDFDRIQFTWRHEGVWVLLWALSLIDDPGPASDIADVPRLAALRDLGTEGVMARARLRPQAELLDAADLIYRQHWAMRRAELDGAALYAELADRLFGGGLGRYRDRHLKRTCGQRG